MALFRCASGSSGGGATITVTYSSDFYGETVTCSHGTKTYSKVATSSGTLEFSVDEEGTWTISCTIGSDTFTTTADVDLTYDAELVSLPNGETVLPTDDIETWLACAAITDKAYTTLSQVLGDSETYNALLGDSNACAYMKRSTTWAGLGDSEVPIMTSDSTPSGLVFYTTKDQSNPYTAFTENTGNDYGWWPSRNNVASTETHIGYKFTEATVIKGVSFLIHAPASSYVGGAVVYVQGSNDSTNGTDGTWTDLSEGVTVPAYSSPSKYVTIDCSGNDTAYLYYRLSNKASSQWQFTNGVLQKIKFHANGLGITDSQYAMNLLGQYDTACDALLSDSTWASAIANSTYFESVLNTKVPTMTSDTTPSGTASYTGTLYSSEYAAYKAFDGSEDRLSLWLASNNSTLTYEFASPMVLKAVRIVPNKYGTFAGKSTTMFIDGYDGNDWVNLLEESLSASDITQENTFSVVNTTDYSKFRLRYDDGSVTYNSTKYCSCTALQLYGRKSSSEKVHGANGESAYILDGGSPITITDPSTLDAGTYTVYSTVAKDPADLSADYSKTIRICPNTKEILVRPDNVLYWWGYNNTVSSAGVVGHSETPTFNTADITLAGTGNNITAFLTDNKMSGTKVHLVGQSSGNVFDFLYATARTGLNPSNLANISHTEALTKGDVLTHNEITYTFSSVYIGAWSRPTGKVYALWHE